MNIKLETLIAIRYFRSRRDESFISISSLFSFLGITIGVATLIIVMSVMNGFRAQLIDKIVGINGHLILYFNDESYKKSDVIGKIETIENVENISKEVEMHSMITSEFNSSGILVKGISKADLFERDSIEENIIEGNLNNFEDKSIIIGSRLATFLRVQLNDQIELISGSEGNHEFQLNGKVMIRSIYMEINCSKMHIYIDQNETNETSSFGSISRILAQGKVQMRQFGRTSNAQSLIFDSKNEEILLENGAEVADSEWGKVKGDKIRIDLKTNRAQVLGSKLERPRVEIPNIGKLKFPNSLKLESN